MDKKILHVIYNEKFAAPFIDFVEKHNLSGNHFFLFFGGESTDKFPLPDLPNVDILHNEDSQFKKLKYFYTADKIIIHSLFNPYLVKFLYKHSWLLKKCYLIMWGGDLYYHVLAKDTPDYEILEKRRKKVIGKMGHILGYVKGDYELAQKWYGAKSTYHKCFKYPSNLYKEYDIKPKKQSITINIQLGNSSDPTNNHIDVLKKLEQYKDKDIKIFTPLSYGDSKYAKEVIETGETIFGDKFIALTEFIPFEKYLEFLGEIDIAIFAHNRQQAMGNTITLLGLGKKVYMRSDVTPWKLFEEIDVKVFDVNDITLDSIDEKVKIDNQKIIKNYFSEENYLKQLQNIFES